MSTTLTLIYLLPVSAIVPQIVPGHRAWWYGREGGQRALFIYAAAGKALVLLLPCRYHQETGRGGRDGEEATCVLFYTYADAMKARHMMQTSAQENNTAPEVVQANNEALNAMVGPLLLALQQTMVEPSVGTS